MAKARLMMKTLAIGGSAVVITLSHGAAHYVTRNLPIATQVTVAGGVVFIVAALAFWVYDTLFKRL